MGEQDGFDGFNTPFDRLLSRFDPVDRVTETASAVRDQFATRSVKSLLNILYSFDDRSDRVPPDYGESREDSRRPHNPFANIAIGHERVA